MQDWLFVSSFFVTPLRATINGESGYIKSNKTLQTEEGSKSDETNMDHKY